MRIISGNLKGKRIIAPHNLPVRPTTDFAKEALFNILNNTWYFKDIAVLDLFSGIGSISLEFASRGTKNITSIDHHMPCVRFLEGISKTLGMSDCIYVIKDDVLRYTSKKGTKVFDIIFADPPYDMDVIYYNQLIDNIFANEWLATGGVLIVEHPISIEFSSFSYFYQKKKYGKVNFSFFS